MLILLTFEKQYFTFFFFLVWQIEGILIYWIKPKMLIFLPPQDMGKPVSTQALSTAGPEAILTWNNFPFWYGSQTSFSIFPPMTNVRTTMVISIQQKRKLTPTPLETKTKIKQKWSLEFYSKLFNIQGRLADSFGKACDSRSRGHEFKPQVGCKNYLKTKQKKNYRSNITYQYLLILPMWCRKRT